MSKPSQHFNKNFKPITEIGDLGNRMALGYPMTHGGAIPGSINLQGFSSPDVAQNPAKFGTGISKRNNINVDKNRESATRLANLTNKSPKNFNKDVDAIKYKVTPDEIICGYQYELQHMVAKDSQLAKQIVVRNLKADPQYYSKLHMLGVYPNSDDIPEKTIEIPDSSFEDGMTLFEILCNDLNKKPSKGKRGFIRKPQIKKPEYKNPPKQHNDWIALGQGKSTDLTNKDPSMKGKWTINWSYNCGKTYKKFKNKVGKL